VERVENGVCWPGRRVRVRDGCSGHDQRCVPMESLRYGREKEPEAIEFVLFVLGRRP
jgi:hypothetical protein